MNNTADYYSKNSQQFASQYQSDSDFHERKQVFFSLLDEFGAGKANALDVGCGSGIFSFYLAKKGVAVTGIDPSQAMLELCSQEKQALKNINVRFMQGALPFDGSIPQLNKVSLILCSSVLEYVTPLESALNELATLLEPGGILIASFPNPSSLSRRLERLRFRMTGKPAYLGLVKNWLSPRIVKEKLARHGLNVFQTRFYAHHNLLSRLIHGFLPVRLTNNLFVVVAQKQK